MKKIKIAVLGCGRIGQMHAKNVALHEKTSLACVYDINQDFANKVASELGVSAVTDDNEIFSNAEIDAILIASPTNTHIEFIEKSVAAKKPVLCEKPIDLDIDKVNACAERLKNNSIPIQLGFNRRFDPGHLAAKNSLVKGEIGDLHQCIITSRDPGIPSWDYLKVAGGQLRDMTIHDFDLARFMLGEEPTRLFAISNALVEPKIKTELNDSDTLMVIMETATGKQCNIINSRSAAYGYDQRVELFGTKGMVISDNRKAHEIKKYSSEFVEKKEPYLNFFIERYQEAYMNEITAFVEAIVNKTSPTVNFEDGRKALILAETAFKSIASGKMETID
jgi:myo-inositol 2-dehydrogenase / D-chiro-inositol 1-dehydrogenase